MAASKRTVRANDWVSAEYSVRDEDGNVIDSSKDSGPMEFVVGYGAVLPHLESEMLGMKVGETRRAVIPPAEAFGEYDAELVFLVDKAELPKEGEIEVGDEFDFVLPTGEADAVVRVLEVVGPDVRCDANHPLAGKQLVYDVKVLTLREATPDEIGEAAAAMDDDEAYDGLDDHDPAAPPLPPMHDSGLVPLRRK